MPVLGLPVTEIEELWETDHYWINRALALQEAQALAEPLRREHEAKRAKERQAAAKERERAAMREQKRQMWRNRKQLEALTEAD